MRHFKVPLIITGIALAISLIAGLIIATKIHREKISDRKKVARAQMLGTGLAMMNLLILAPVWIFAAAKFGNEKRAARRAAELGGDQPQ